MIYKKLLLLLLCVFLLGLSVNVITRKKSENKINLKNSLGISTLQINRPTHSLAFFEKNTFYAGVEQSKNENKSFKNHIVGGIIPHHLLPSFIITDFFNRLSKQNPKTIILIGPNHYERGDHKVLSSLYGWETPFGVVEPDEQIIKELTKSKLIKIDEANLPKDHAVAGIMPFLKYYLPDTKVIPLLLSGFMAEEDVRILASNLKNYLNKDNIIIAAVDFSHYLISEQAKEKDIVTLEVIKIFDYRQLFSLNNDYVDSPSSIATLLMVMQMLGTTKMDLLYHTNSGELQKNNFIETTSYFSIAYY